MSSSPPLAHLSRMQMLLAYVVGSFGFGFQSMVSLVIPLRLLELGAPLELIGIIVGAGSVVPAIFAVSSGALADRFGPHRTYALGAFICVPTTLVLYFTSSYWIILLALIFQVFARSTAWVAAQTYITGVGPRERQATIVGRFSFATNAGQFAGPVLAGTAADLVGLQNSFLVLTAVAAAYTLIGFFLPDVRSRDERATASKGRPSVGTAGFGSALTLLKLPGIRVAMLLTLMRLWVWSGWVTYFPVLLSTRGFETTLIGTILSVSTAFAMVTTLGVGRLARFATLEQLIAAALALGALGVALTPHLAAMPQIFIASLLLGIGSGVSLPLLMASVRDSAPPHLRGVALGMRGSANQMAAGLSPAFVGFLATGLGLATAFAASAAIAWVVLGATTWYHVVSRRQAARPAPPASQT